MLSFVPRTSSIKVAGEPLLRGNTKGLIAVRGTPKIRIVSWMQLSKRLNCDRATLTHLKRIHWTAKRKEAIEGLIKDTKASVEHKEEETTDAVTALQSQLTKQRSETAQWYERCKEKEALIKELLAELEKKNSKIEELNRIIRTLTNRGDNDSDVIKLQ